MKIFRESTIKIANKKFEREYIKLVLKYFLLVHFNFYTK